MVSLARNDSIINTTERNTTLTTDSDPLNMDSERQEHLLPLDSIGVFQPLQTLHLFSFHLLFTLLLDVISIVYAIIHPNNYDGKCHEYFIIIYLHIAYWFLTVIIHFITKHFHYQIRLKGYFNFYKANELHSHLPLFVVSIWVVLLLFIQTLMQHFYPDNFAEKCIHGGTLSPKFYLCAIITLEFFTIAGINISYMFKVINFNKTKPPPDIQKDDWLASSNPEAFVRREIGLPIMGAQVYSFLEKQAALLEYLKEHNERLARKVMELNLQIQHLQNDRSGSTNLP